MLSSDKFRINLSTARCCPGQQQLHSFSFIGPWNALIIPGPYTFTEVCVRFTMVVNSCATIITHLHPAVMSLVISYSQDFTSMLSSCLQLPYTIDITRSTNTWDGGPLSWPIWVFNMRSKLSQNQVQATYLCRVSFRNPVHLSQSQHVASNAS